MELKNDALYMKSHEWVVIDGDTASVQFNTCIDVNFFF